MVDLGKSWDDIFQLIDEFHYDIELEKSPIDK